MAGENKTVLETEALGASGKGILYTITKKQAETVLTKLGHADNFITGHPNALEPGPKMETFLGERHAFKLQKDGGLEGKIARVATKYLRYEGSTTTILLSKEEHKKVQTLGAALKKA